MCNCVGMTMRSRVGVQEYCIVGVELLSEAGAVVDVRSVDGGWSLRRVGERGEIRYTLCSYCCALVVRFNVYPFSLEVYTTSSSTVYLILYAAYNYKVFVLYIPV